MTAVRTETARINGIAMRYAVEGKSGAPTVVLHHPLATNLTFWDELTAALAPNYRVVRFDARGHGKTEAPVGRYPFEVLATDVTALMDHLGIAKAAFVGLSMGGMIAQYLGILSPGRFNSIAIIASSSRVAPEFRPLWSDRVVAARKDGMTSQVQPALGRWITEVNRKSRPDLVARLSAMIETTPLEGYAGWCNAIEHLDVTHRLSAVTLPTLVVSGALDPGTPPAAGEVVHKAIKGSEFAVIPNVAHMLACEDPAAFHAVLLPFLAKHAR